MKLGIAPGSYLFTRGLVPNGDSTSRRFELLGPPLRYYQEHPKDFMTWLMERSRHYRKAYGLSSIVLQLDRIDEVYLRKIKKLMDANGVHGSYLAFEPDFRSTDGSYFVASPETFKKSLPGVVKYSEAAKKLGQKIIGTGNPAHLVGRFKKGVPLEKQLNRYSVNIREVAHIASSYNQTVAIENTGDFRMGELIKVIRDAKCDNLMMNFDTGNTMLVVEDPVEAAKRAAPYTISTHLKDNFFQTVVWYGAKIFGVPIGEGHIDFPKILDILEKNAPDPKSLTLNVEVMAQEGDEDEMVQSSLRYVRDHFGSYLE